MYYNNFDDLCTVQLCLILETKHQHLWETEMLSWGLMTQNQALQKQECFADMGEVQPRCRGCEHQRMTTTNQSLFSKKLGLSHIREEANEKQILRGETLWFIMPVPSLPPVAPTYKAEVSELMSLMTEKYWNH